MNIQGSKLDSLNMFLGYTKIQQKNHWPKTYC